ncbi:uncharacterized protein [Battus philenor]|uniref:uncharacterized protein isoform X2 n=1 Tax=Battus philenor TaxID=42288 RepID=UPI0035CE91E3
MDTARCERMEGVEMKCSTPNGSAQASDTSTNAPQKHKHSDDSGYVEAVMLDDRKSSGKESSELREKILDLQTQLNTLKRLASLKLGGVYEIKKPESYILQERREESFNEKVVEPSTLPPAQVPKSRLNIPISRGILEKPDEYYKTHKKDEKMAKTVSYEDIIFNPPHKENMRNVLTKTEEQSDLQIVGYSPSDEKHFDDAANKRTNDNICIKEQSESKESSHKPDKLQTCDFASDKPQKTFKEHKKTSRSLNANRKYSKDEGKTNFYSEQTPRDSKKIGIDIPETERLPTKETTDLTSKNVPNVPNIEIVKSDSSNKIVPADEIISRAPCIIPVSDKDEIKVIKDVRSVSDINLTKADVNGGRKEKIREEDISKDKDFRKTSDQKKKSAKKLGSPTHESSRPSSGNTYVVKAEAAVQRCVRAGSPQDTDGEISGLTDLPDEREASPRSILSPGEEKPTSTYTETYTSTADYITLSEGELPVAVSGKAPMSPGERSWKNSTGEITPPRATSQKMEEALKAISEELARCRYLLQHQRPQVINRPL